jgi:predicted metalloprotease
VALPASASVRRAIGILGLASLVLATAACTQAVDGTPSSAPVPNAKLPVRGDSASAFDTETKNAISDVTAFWKQEYPTVAHGAALPPLKGALYSIDGLQVLKTHALPSYATGNACLRRDHLFIVDNAAYCQLDDSILWDRGPQHILPLLASRYGAAITALVFAHEFGHAIQQRLHVPDSTPTIDAESQADCASGAFIAAAMKGQAPHFHLTPGQVDRALDGFLQIRDSTPESPQDISHGDGFDRLSALQQGITRGVAYCFAPGYLKNRNFTERGYTDSDLFTGGNEPLSAELTPAGGLTDDLNRFWKGEGTVVHHTFSPMKIIEAEHPACGARSAQTDFGYCPATNAVYYSSDFAHRAYYSLTALNINRSTGNVELVRDQPADFALGMMFSIAWGMAARHEFFNGSTDDRAGLLAAICYAGAYAEDVNLPNADVQHPFVLSPPDMDEATSAVLSLVDLPQAFGARDTTGLQRVSSFVTGYNQGLSSC